MNNTQRNELIAKYCREELSPTKEQRGKISVRYEELTGFLNGSCFQSGSYARFTAVRPPKDLDVIWVCSDHRIETDPRPLLEDLSDSLVDSYGHNSNERIQCQTQDHSISIMFEDDPDGFSIDVVPAVVTNRLNEFGDPIYCVPEIQKLSHMQRKSFQGTARWIESDPKGYVGQARDLDELTQGRFRKAVKVVKAWRQKHKKELGDEFKLKAFHLEQLMTQYMETNPYEPILNAIQAVFGSLNTAIESPSIPDRANSGVFIDQYVADLTSKERAKILILQRAAFESLVRLETAKSESEVKELLDSMTQASVAQQSSRIAAPAVVIARPAQPYANIE